MTQKLCSGDTKNSHRLVNKNSDPHLHSPKLGNSVATWLIR